MKETSRRLLPAARRAGAGHQIHGVDADDRPVTEQFAQDAGRVRSLRAVNGSPGKTRCEPGQLALRLQIWNSNQGTAETRTGLP